MLAKRRSRLLLSSAFVFVTSLALANAARAADQTYQFDIPAESLSQALTDFSQASSQQIIYSEGLVRGKTIAGLHGRYTAQQALQALLAGSDLKAETNAAGVLMVRPKNAQAASNEAAPRTEERVETVVVTGTNIRGVTNPAVPVSSYTRDQIDLSGTGSVQQFLKRMPQNFGGGASDETIGTLAGGGNAVNAVNGAGVNLRGLGSDATLVLVNGHRIAPANNSGNFVDISMIPLSVVDHVDVLTDGASAIYGSDAVGGVVNIVLRHDFDGAETRAHYSTSTDGGGEEEEGAQTFGRTWSDGSALITYDFDTRTPIQSSDRSYAKANANPTTLVPEQTKHGVFASADQTLASNVEIFGEALWSHRSSASDINYIGIGDQRNTVGTENYGGTFGANIGLGGDRELVLSTTYNANSSNQVNFSSGALAAHVHTNTAVETADLKFDGPLFSLGAGPVRFAFGTQYRHETFDSKDLVGNVVFSPDRSIIAAFAELNVPLLGPEDPLAAGHLEVNLADRFEHYSDFGATNNPKFGVSFRPIEGLKLRGSYGTSFRAPLLNDLNPQPFQVVALQEFDPTTLSAANVMVVFGGNPNLRPERSTNWTLGADFAPEIFPQLHLSATYYNDRFAHMITTAQTAGFDLFNALQNAATFGPLIQRNPPLSEVTNFATTAVQFADFTGIPGGVDLTTIAAIIDSRSTNLSVLDTNGIDFKLDYDDEFSFGHLTAGLAGTYIITYKEQVAPATPTMSVLNTQYNPVDLKLRGSLVLTRGNITAVFFANFTDSYRDVRPAPSVPISSWTTFDLGLQYDFADCSGLLSGLTGGLNINNILDKDPPFVATPAPGIAPGLVFDGANAGVWGRVISVQLTERW